MPLLFRTIWSAFLAGLLAGICLFLIQRLLTVPLIHTAEIFEKAARADSQSDDALADEPLRSISTLIADIFVATAFGLILTGIYAASGRDGWVYGLFCGLLGFATFQLAPALVVPPAVPGLEVAPLALRQIAWWASATSAAVGIIFFFILPKLAKLAGVLFYVMPIAVFRLLFPVHMPTSQSPAIATIQRSFVIRTLASTIVFWLILGAASGYFFVNQGDQRSAA